MKKNHIFKFTKIRIHVIIEIILILIYLFLILFSINLFPINIFLGIMCILFLPGYNILNLIKPRFSFIERLGYMTILSLVIENIIMFLSYIFLYDIVTTPESPAFFFNNVLLLFLIQILNIVLIIMNELRQVKQNKIKDFHTEFNICNKENNRNNNKIIDSINFESLKEKINEKILVVFICYIVFLILLCITTFYSYDPKTASILAYYYYNYYEYLFFYKVPFSFYIFLSASILCLAYIIFFVKNRYLTLISISIFLYCLWILPYLQIGYYFNGDSYALSTICKNYYIYGIRADQENSFLVYLDYRNAFGPFRYPTSVFTGIILAMATGVSVDVTLWYLYPIIFAPIPFFFYSIFQKFSKKDEYQNLNLLLLTILSVLTPQFIKYAHSATTGVLGTYTYLILVVELFDFLNNEIKQNKRFNFLLIFLLFFFLCLTRLEECIYFIMLILFSCGYFFYIERKNIEKNNLLGIRNLKMKLIWFVFALLIFSFLFDLTQEFFGYIEQYLYSTFEGNPYAEDILYTLYENTKIELLNFSRIGFTISIFLLGALILGIFILFIVYYIFLFKHYNIVLKIVRIIKMCFKKVFDFLINKILAKKITQYLIIPLIFIIIFTINLWFYPFLQEQGLFLIIEIFGSYALLIFNIFLFIRGVKYYSLKNDKQNFFLLAIITSSSLMVGLFLIGNITFSYYILNARFFSYFTFFNLIIIQNNYFKDFVRKKKIFLIFLIISLVFLGTFYSLRKLAFG